MPALRELIEHSGLQNRDALEQLLGGVVKTRDELPASPITAKKPKLVLKIAPDLNETQLIEIAEVIRKSNIDGVIVSNTTIQRPSHLLNCATFDFILSRLNNVNCCS